jgi:hypothetical protein
MTKDEALKSPVKLTDCFKKPYAYVDAVAQSKVHVAPARKMWLKEREDKEWRDFHSKHQYDIPLYTAPPKREWQGLTDDERRAIVREFGVWTFSNEWLACLEVEAKLKEKNNAP